MRCILSFDVGTTGLKTIIVNESGEILRSYNIEYGMIRERDGYAEQDPLVWWETVLKGIRAVIDDKTKYDIKAIGVSGQFQSLVMLDEKNSPLRNAILWCDHRGEEMLSEITDRVGEEELIRITANPALAGSTVSSFLWVRKYEPHLFEKCRHIMLPHEYIRMKLTGEYATDVTSASSMQLLHMSERAWSPEIFGKLGLDSSIVGHLCECSEIVGTTTKEVERLTGLPQGIPVVAGGGDSVISAVGTGVITAGSCFTSIGTSGIICTNTDQIQMDRAGRVNTYCSAVPGKWTVITCSITSGFALKWMKDTFCEEEKRYAKVQKTDVYDELAKLASTVKPGADGLLFLPYLMGDRTPHLNPNARGVFFGIAPHHTKAHFIRAVMEGVAYSLKDGIEVMNELGIELQEFVLCGGGAKGAVWRNIIADIYGHPVSTVQNDSGSAIGAAVLAAYGSGIYGSLEDAVEHMIRKNEPEYDTKDNHRLYMEYWKTYRELYRSLEHVFG